MERTDDRIVIRVRCCNQNCEMLNPVVVAPSENPDIILGQLYGRACDWCGEPIRSSIDRDIHERVVVQCMFYIENLKLRGFITKDRADSLVKKMALYFDDSPGDNSK